MNTFGQLLQQHRAAARLAQNALARQSGVNVGTVNRLERDMRLPPSPVMVHQLARVLCLSPGEIDRLLLAAGFSATERRGAAGRRWRRWGAS